MSHTTLTLGDRGRVVIPAETRKRLGLKTGDALVLSEHGEEIRLMPLAARIKAMHGAWAHLSVGRSVVDELIAERRAEAAREDAEYAAYRS
jgi:AbrB family looped-hinge helix DNA binding protein